MSASMHDGLQKALQRFLVHHGCDLWPADRNRKDGRWMLKVLQDSPLHGPNFLAMIMVMIEQGYWSEGEQLIDNDENPWKESFSKYLLVQYPDIAPLV